MLNHVLEGILHLHGGAALAVVFLLPALEASIFLGFLVPGEIAVLLGGVLAFNHRVSLTSVLVVAIAGAVIGDQVGYAIGRRYGERILRKVPDRFIDEARMKKAQATVRRLGAKAVIVGRWTAALRALVPGAAGMAHLPYLRFTIANFVGGAGWATACVLAGYFAGNGWRTARDRLGSASLILLGVVVVIGALVAWRRHRSHT